MGKKSLFSLFSHCSGAQQPRVATALGSTGLEHSRPTGQCCCCCVCSYLAQRGRLLVHAGHRVLYERGVWHIGGPGVPSAYEGRAALLVPLDANPKTFPPTEWEERDQTSHSRPWRPRAPAQPWV